MVIPHTILLIGGFGGIGSLAFMAQKALPRTSPSPRPGHVSHQVAAPAVSVLPTPDGGIQPQGLMGKDGTLHLLFFKGKPEAGDLFYVTRKRGASSFSSPLRVNRKPGAAIAVGTIRGGQMALGRNGTVHVVWNGSDQARPKGPQNSVPLLYSRFMPSQHRFKAERNLMQSSSSLDGGGSIAADEAGNVYAFWHGIERAGQDETQRKLWLATSRDNGDHFTPESAAVSEATGACGCCSVKAFASRRGTVLALYRAARENVHRDMTLAVSSNNGATFQSLNLSRWNLNACPMSSESITETRHGILGAWETEGKIHLAPLATSTRSGGKRWEITEGTGSAKHPSVAANAHGDLLLAWTEGTGWMKGGDLAWQVYSPTGRPLGTQGRLRGGISVWSLPSAVALPNGSFTIFH